MAKKGMSKKESYLSRVCVCMCVCVQCVYSKNIRFLELEGT